MLGWSPIQSRRRRNQPQHDSMLRAVVALSLAYVTDGVAAPQKKLSTAAWDRIARGAVHVERDWLSPELCAALRADACDLKAQGLFRGDGLYEAGTGKPRAKQGFSAGDRQTYKAGWGADAGDVAARAAFGERLAALRSEARRALGRPTLGSRGAAAGDETTYNWYEPLASLKRHIDERHEEVKGREGWRLPTRRSVTWLVYLNDGWADADGGALRCYERSRGLAAASVGARGGDVQVGWLPRGAAEGPVFLGDDADMRHVLYAGDAAVAPPFDDARRMLDAAPPGFEPVVGAVADPRASPLAGETVLDVAPRAGTLVIFDSVAVPHEVLPVTAARPRVACTGWFHEELPEVA